MKKSVRPRVLFAVMVGMGAALACLDGQAGAEDPKPGHRLLLKSAIENADFTEVTLPIFEGRRGVHWSPKMANGKGTLAVQKVAVIDGTVHFLGSVDFSPERIVTPSVTGFPPKEATPGAIGEALYTPHDRRIFRGAARALHVFQRVRSGRRSVGGSQLHSESQGSSQQRLKCAQFRVDGPGSHRERADGKNESPAPRAQLGAPWRR